MDETPESRIDETLRRKFEDAWSSGRPAPIEECLPAPDDPHRLPTLEELVHIELEFAWKGVAGRPDSFAGAPRVEQYLERYPDLDRPEIVRRLLEQEYRVRQRYGDRPEVDDYRRRFPRVVETGEELLGTPAAAGPAPAGAPSAPHGGAFAERYHLLAEHARGGFGAVWRARDLKLGREVAVKRLSPPLAERPEYRRRFVGEARIAARLEHPGIVPVYDLGEREEDAAYYAMKLVRGDTLAAAIGRFHAQPADAPERPVDERRLLNAFLLVCQTMEYSHARGVIHRDLKPQNIILGDYGETIVLDWGLAKNVAEKDAATGGDEAAGESASPGLTRPGTVQGTPAYMAPEQAEGRGADIDELSDIYALGAILYQLLTGRLPFEAPTADEVLRKVRNERPPRPRAIDPRIPASLEAICLKAMAAERTARYPAVAALTRDVQRFLADEPVSVYREPWTRRCGRWMRRHRTLVTGGAAATVVALVALAILAAVLAVAKERLEKANLREQSARNEAERRRGEAERERRRAEANFGLAREAVDRYYVKVSEDPKLRAEGLEGLRKDLLRAAGHYYEKFAAQKGGDRDIERDRGWAYLRLAVITAETGSPSGAIEHLERAREIFRALVTAYPESTRYVLDLAQCENSLANRRVRMQDDARAEAHYLRALELLDGIPADHPDRVDADYNRGRFLNNLAVLHDRAGRLEKAEKRYRAALEVQERLVAEKPEDRDYRRELASTHLNLGAICGVLGRPEACESAYREVIRLAGELIAEDPRDPDHPALLATARHNLANHLKRTGQLDEARSQYAAALEAWRQLAARHPDVPDFLHKLAGTRTSLGNLHAAQGDWSRALEEHREARKVREALIVRQPSVPVHRHALAGIHLNIGLVHAQTGRLEEAERALEKAVELGEALAEAFPRETRYALDAGSANQLLGQIVAAAGRPEEALDCYAEAATLLESILRKAPQHAAGRANRRQLAELRAELWDTLARHGDAAAEWERARELAAPEDRERLDYRRGLSLGRGGDHRAAAAAGRELLERKEKDGGACCRAAVLLAMAAVAADRDRELDESARAVISEGHAKGAVAALESARALGYLRTKEGREALRGPFLASLREREDFRALVKRIRDG